MKKADKKNTRTQISKSYLQYSQIMYGKLKYVYGKTLPATTLLLMTMFIITIRSATYYIKCQFTYIYIYICVYNFI